MNEATEPRVHFKIYAVPTMTLLIVTNICVINDHECVPFSLSHHNIIFRIGIQYFNDCSTKNVMYEQSK